MGETPTVVKARLDPERTSESAFAIFVQDQYERIRHTRIRLGLPAIDQILLQVERSMEEHSESSEREGEAEPPRGAEPHESTPPEPNAVADADAGADSVDNSFGAGAVEHRRMPLPVPVPVPMPEAEAPGERVDLSALIEMGFASASIEKAIALTQGDVEQATELLLDPAFDSGDLAAEETHEDVALPAPLPVPVPEAMPEPALEPEAEPEVQWVKVTFRLQTKGVQPFSERFKPTSTTAEIYLHLRSIMEASGMGGSNVEYRYSHQPNHDAHLPPLSP